MCICYRQAFFPSPVAGDYIAAGFGGGEWDSVWDDGAQAYYYLHRTTGESRWDEPPDFYGPVASDWDPVWDDGAQAYYYLHRTTGETRWDEPPAEHGGALVVAAAEPEHYYNERGNRVFMLPATDSSSAH